MTCEEINEQITELTNQFNTLNDTVGEENSDIIISYAACILADSYGGTLPGSPPTQSGVSARVSWLMSHVNPPPAVMGQWGSLETLITNRDANQAALSQTIDMLGEMKQQAVDQNC